jgi:hypothetical protein
MAHAFTIIPAKPAFGNFNPHLTYADVMANKRSNLAYCQCTSTNVVRSQGELISIRKISRNNCPGGCNRLPFNKSNLEVNLITELYLQNILILENNANPGVPAKIDPSLTPIYSYYTIDPGNKLVGDTPCGIQKYINYMIIDTNSIIEGGCPDDVVVVNCFCQP